MQPRPTTPLQRNLANRRNADISLMATSNSPTLWPLKLPQAGMGSLASGLGRPWMADSEESEAA